MHDLTLAEMCDGLARRTFSSAELTRHLLARIAAANPVYNAFITVDEAGALARRLEEIAAAHANGALPQPPRVNAFSWNEMAPRYRRLIETTCR